MIEKNAASSRGDDSTVVVEGFVCSPQGSVGAAIQELEEKLASKGIVMQVPEVTRDASKDKACGKLLRLPTMIHLAIEHAIDSSTGAMTQSNVGTMKYDYTNVLVAGSVVALYDKKKGCFLRMVDDRADFYGGRTDLAQLSMTRVAERFVVVRARNDCIAFYNPSQRRFLGCCQGSMTTGYPIVHFDEYPRGNDSFRVIPHTSRGGFQLLCSLEREYPLPSVVGCFKVVKLHGFD